MKTRKKYFGKGIKYLFLLLSLNVLLLSPFDLISRAYAKNRIQQNKNIISVMTHK